MHSQSVAKQQSNLGLNQRPLSQRSHLSSGRRNLPKKLSAASSIVSSACLLTPQSLEEHKQIMEALDEQFVRDEQMIIQQASSQQQCTGGQRGGSSGRFYPETPRSELSLKKILVMKWLQAVEQARSSNSLASVSTGY